MEVNSIKGSFRETYNVREEWKYENFNLSRVNNNSTPVVVCLSVGGAFDQYLFLFIYKTCNYSEY